MTSIILKPHEASGIPAGRVGLIVRPVTGFEMHPAVIGMEPCEDGRFRFIGHPEGQQRYISTFPFTARIRSPFGKPGDVLACRETWKPDVENDTREELGVSCITYKADGREIRIDNSLEAADLWLDVRRPEEQYPEFAPVKWRSASQMPLWAVRTHILNLSVSVKRVREVTEDEARLAGFSPCEHNEPMWQGYLDINGSLSQVQGFGADAPPHIIEPKPLKPIGRLWDARKSFEIKWQTTYPRHPWDTSFAWFCAIEQTEPVSAGSSSSKFSADCQRNT